MVDGPRVVPPCGLEVNGGNASLAEAETTLGVVASGPFLRAEEHVIIDGNRSQGTAPLALRKDTRHPVIAC